MLRFLFAVDTGLSLRKYFCMSEETGAADAPGKNAEPPLPTVDKCMPLNKPPSPEASNPGCFCFSIFWNSACEMDAMAAFVCVEQDTGLFY
jgi:hypothetical protein